MYDITQLDSPLQQHDNFDFDWVENLALDEINMEESGIVHMNEHLDPVHFLEESSIEFMNNLRDRFEILVTKFNEYRGLGPNNPTIKIFKISNTVNDFMLFRNSLRLIIARKAQDLISIGFLSTSGTVFAPRINGKAPMQQGTSHEIKAHIGVFNKITWNFSGEPVHMDAMVKHYLSEFIRNSAR